TLHAMFPSVNNYGFNYDDRAASRLVESLVDGEQRYVYRIFRAEGLNNHPDDKPVVREQLFKGTGKSEDGIELYLPTDWEQRDAVICIPEDHGDYVDILVPKHFHEKWWPTSEELQAEREQEDSGTPFGYDPDTCEIDLSVHVNGKTI